MRHFALAVALLAMAGLTGSSVRAAELEIPPPRSAENSPIQKGLPNCSQWTDDCVNCTRGAAGEGPVCTNIGVACQPRAIRCVAPEPAKK